MRNSYTVIFQEKSSMIKLFRFIEFILNIAVLRNMLQKCSTTLSSGNLNFIKLMCVFQF